MFPRASKLAALSAATWLALPLGLAAAQEPEEAAPPTGPACGGFAGLACPEGYSCVDDPSDTCDPNDSGADCAGICTADDSARQTDSQKPKKGQCDYSDPNLQYVSRDPEQCAAIRFVCDAGFEPFFNDCGCGCQPIAQ